MALRAALLRGAGAARGAAPAPPGLAAAPSGPAAALWRCGAAVRSATTRGRGDGRRGRREDMSEDDYRRAYGSGRYSDGEEEDGYGSAPSGSWRPEDDLLPPDAEPPGRGASRRRGQRRTQDTIPSALDLDPGSATGGPSTSSASTAGSSGASSSRPPLRRGARFLKSSSEASQCPAPTLPEFALVGRSNAGKSSLVNALTGRRDLAAVSKTPGKTRLINHFEVDGAWRLVDLPGYGFARASKSDTLGWSEMTSEFIQTREGLARVLLLVDASIPPTRIDVAAAEFLAAAPAWGIVFTKADKRKRKMPKPHENVDEFLHTLRAMGVDPPPSFLTSAKDRGGVQDLLRAFREWTEEWNQHEHTHNT